MTTVHKDSVSRFETSMAMITEKGVTKHQPSSPTSEQSIQHEGDDATAMTGKSFPSTFDMGDMQDACNTSMQSNHSQNFNPFVIPGDPNEAIFQMSQKLSEVLTDFNNFLDTAEIPNPIEETPKAKRSRKKMRSLEEQLKQWRNGIGDNKSTRRKSTGSVDDLPSLADFSEIDESDSPTGPRTRGLNPTITTASHEKSDDCKIENRLVQKESAKSFVETNEKMEEMMKFGESSLRAYADSLFESLGDYEFPPSPLSAEQSDKKDSKSTPILHLDTTSSQVVIPKLGIDDAQSEEIASPRTQIIQKHRDTTKSELLSPLHRKNSVSRSHRSSFHSKSSSFVSPPRPGRKSAGNLSNTIKTPFDDTSHSHIKLSDGYRSSLSPRIQQSSLRSVLSDSSTNLSSGSVMSRSTISTAKTASIEDSGDNGVGTKEVCKKIRRRSSISTKATEYSSGTSSRNSHSIHSGYSSTNSPRSVRTSQSGDSRLLEHNSFSTLSTMYSPAASSPQYSRKFEIDVPPGMAFMSSIPRMPMSPCVKAKKKEARLTEKVLGSSERDSPRAVKHKRKSQNSTGTNHDMVSNAVARTSALHHEETKRRSYSSLQTKTPDSRRTLTSKSKSVPSLSNGGNTRRSREISTSVPAISPRSNRSTRVAISALISPKQRRQRLIKSERSSSPRSSPRGSPRSRQRKSTSGMICGDTQSSKGQSSMRTSNERPRLRRGSSRRNSLGNEKDEKHPRARRSSSGSGRKQRSRSGRHSWGSLIGHKDNARDHNNNKERLNDKQTGIENVQPKPRFEKNGKEADSSRTVGRNPQSRSRRMRN